MEGELIFVVMVLATIAIIYLVATVVLIYRAFIEKRIEGIAAKPKKRLDADQARIRH